MSSFHPSLQHADLDPCQGELSATFAALCPGSFEPCYLSFQRRGGNKFRASDSPAMVNASFYRSKNWSPSALETRAHLISIVLRKYIVWHPLHGAENFPHACRTDKLSWVSQQKVVFQPGLSTL